VEVLAGPQGTLFGRNASAGLVQIITKNPSFQPAMNVDVGYGNYDTSKVQVYASGGLTDKLAADIAVVYNNQGESWGKNLATGNKYGFEDYKAVRSKLLFKPDDATEALLSFDYTKSNSDTGIVANQYGGTTAGSLVPPHTQAFPAPFYDANNAIDPSSVNEGWSASAKVSHDFSYMTISSLSNYQRTSEQINEDAANFPVANELAYLSPISKSYSEELQVQSLKGSAFDWIGALYYLNDFSGYDPSFLRGPAIAGALKTPMAYIDNTAFQRTQAISTYGQMTIHFSDATNLTLGARYNYDVDHAYGTELGVKDDGVPFHTLANVDVSRNFEKSTFKVALDHHFFPDVMGYVSFSSGFKDGTFNLLTIAPGPVEPETVDNYEIGAKTAFLDNRIRVNAALFYTELHNPQVKELINGTATLINADGAFSRGGEINIDAKVTRNFTARVGLTVLDAKYTNFDNAPFTTANPKSPYGNHPFTAQSADGKWLSHASPVTATAGFDYVVPSSIGTFDFDMSDYYNAGFYWDPDNVQKQRAFNIVDSELSLALPDHHWSVALWGKNITKTQYYIYETEFGNPSGNAGAAAPPATYGLRASFKY
jgi:iron complex outermembrane receptor protein